MLINIKTKSIYSVRELNLLVRRILNQEFTESIWVQGEIQDYDRSKSKSDIYFKLCEKHPEIDEVIASVSAVIFSDHKSLLTYELNQLKEKIELKDGLEVKLLCKIDFFPRSGKFILIVEGIDPFYTLGKIAQGRQKIIEELKQKGLLDKNKKLPLSLVPLNIGLITSFDSAAYNDFMDELKKSSLGFKIYFFNSFMQGKNVEPDILKALGIFEKMNFLDAVVITRGGGSTADLSWFDNKTIAERIANFKFPVLTGIGHEINTTVTDLVAHTFFKTPTALAQFLVERVRNFLENLDETHLLLIKETENILKDKKSILNLRANSLEVLTLRFLKAHHEKIVSLKENIFLSIRGLLQNLKIKPNALLKELFLNINYYLENKKKEVNNYAEKIKILDPLNILKRGFSITQNSGGKIIKSIEEIEENEMVYTLLHDGNFKSQIIKKERKEYGKRRNKV